MKTVVIHGSNGEVMAPFGQPGTLIRGKRTNLRIIAVGKNKEVPLATRQALVGIILSSIFTREQIIRQCGKSFENTIPFGTRLCYAHEVIETLEKNHQKDAAEALRKIIASDLDMYTLEEGIYHIQEED